MFGLGFQELLIVGVVAVLLFGRRLPEVAKSLGGSYREFRKGLADIQSTIDFSDTSSTRAAAPKRSYSSYDDYDEPTAPKFELPPSEPKVDSPPSERIEKPNGEK